MREGLNPTKGGKLIVKSPCSHRVIIPVHIPNEEGYFKDSYRIFELCLFSIYKTSLSNIKISVISNKCSAIINDRLMTLYNDGYIDELIIEKEGIGKINSILKALRTVEERLITITDADVLFLSDWEESIVDVFESFPNAGVVCPVPVFRKHFELTANIWIKYFFSKKVAFRPVKNPESMTLFAKSIGWEWLDLKYKDVIGTIKSDNGKIAVLGCSHFVATYKREVFDFLPKENSIYLIDGDSEFKYTDQPVFKAGGYRLSTYDNHAFHMGNVKEQWMENTFNSLLFKEKDISRNYDYLPKLRRSRINNLFSEIIFKKIILKKKFQKIIFQIKGLDKEKIKNFVN